MPVDLASRLRAIVRPAGSSPAGAVPPRRELTYEPDDGYRVEVRPDLEQIANALGGGVATTPFGPCVAIDRRYESDRCHGDLRVGDCEPGDLGSLGLLDPAFEAVPGHTSASRIVFLDLETTGLSGGAGTIAFLVGCGFFDLGAFQVRQFLLVSHGAERALLAAAGELFADASLIVTYNGKSFDVPVMETRWAFHRLPGPFDHLPHFDMVHPARRLWKGRIGGADDGGCRLTTLERVLLNMRRTGDVPGFEIPARYFHFLRTGDPAPLEPVLEHNRLDLVSLAALMRRALGLAAGGEAACRDAHEALALGRILERAGQSGRAEACYRAALAASCTATKGEALYRLGLRCRRDRRFDEAASCWRELLALNCGSARRGGVPEGLRQFAIEALAIHHEHRDRDLPAARELALSALAATASPHAGGIRHRLARLDRKLARERNGTLFAPQRLQRGNVDPR
jgi:uncharacterized protein